MAPCPIFFSPLVPRIPSKDHWGSRQTDRDPGKQAASAGEVLAGLVKLCGQCRAFHVDIHPALSHSSFAVLGQFAISPYQGSTLSPGHLLLLPPTYPSPA